MCALVHLESICAFSHELMRKVMCPYTCSSLNLLVLHAGAMRGITLFVAIWDGGVFVCTCVCSLIL